MHLVQDWTLGILYVRIAMRIFLTDAEGRPARAMGQIFANGYLNPDARRATRYFVLPCLLAFTLAMGVPFGVARLVNATGLLGSGAEDRVRVVRLVYPLTAGAGVTLYLGKRTVNAAGRWRARIRDEVYLVGERLHNFGERRRDDKGKARASSVGI
jgi:E3 ubiquitin-protein ligase MARCH6